MHGVQFTVSALELQVKMATSKQSEWMSPRGTKSQGQSLAAQVFLNKTAAYEAGFIGINDLPLAMAFFYGRQVA